MTPERRDGVTDDAVLGGRLRLRQPRRGHRVGHDAILLAAACPARPGAAVVDLGAGVGAAGLAVATRVAGTMVTLVEIDPPLAALAAENATRNGLAARVRVVTLDVAAPARAFAAKGLAAERADAVIMNPPFNEIGRQRVSPDPARALAHTGAHAGTHAGGAADARVLPVWLKTAARLLKPRGTVTLIWRADGLAAVLAALAPAFGGVVVTPVYPQPGKPAIRIIAGAVKGSRGPLRLAPSLILADASGQPTAAAEALLRDAAALDAG